MSKLLPSFMIEDWFAWAPEYTSQSDWQSWSESPQPITGQASIDATTVPPLIRRRCSMLSKMLLEAANKVTKKVIDNDQLDQISYAVFCSQHGELDHSVKLLKFLTNEESLSPMNFTQSVHNTASGLYTIINKLGINCSSIAAGNSTFMMGMLDALTWLAQNQHQYVLVVMGDNHIPEEFDSLNVKPSDQYAIAFLLRAAKKGENGISVIFSANQDTLRPRIPLALQFLSWYLTSAQTHQYKLQQQSDHQIAEWYVQT